MNEKEKAVAAAAVTGVMKAMALKWAVILVTTKIAKRAVKKMEARS